MIDLAVPRFQNLFQGPRESLQPGAAGGVLTGMGTPRKLSPLPSPLPFQTPGEEIANSLLHGIGILLAAGGLVLLILRAGGSLGGIQAHGLSRARAVVCYSIYAATMISMFLASTLYHAIQAEGAKRIFRVLDHSSVFLLIAGSYTPFSLLGLRGGLGWVYFSIEWTLAIAGVVLYSVNCKFLRRLELTIYLLMGWAIIAGMFRLWKTLPRTSFFLLWGGGLAYTLGILWYKRQHRRLSHVIWHLHVIAGTVCHWFSLFLMS